MSRPVEIAKSNSRLSVYWWPAVVLLALVAMALDTKVVDIGTKQDIQTDVFSAHAYGKKEFPRIQAEIEKTAVDAKVLATAIAQDKAAAGKKYGKPGSVGPIFPVKFSGTVEKGRNGIFTVAADGIPEDLTIRVQMGPAINGTDVRDATGTVSFGQFINQIDYQNAGAALNDEVKSHVLIGIDRDKLEGKKIEVVGVFQLINPANWLVTPVWLRLQ